MKLKRQAMTQGGLDLAVRTIENTYINDGADHLVNIETNKKYKKMSRCSSCLSDCFSWVIWITLIVYTVKYWMLVEDAKKIASSTS